jgi:hypothetical protein
MFKLKLYEHWLNPLILQKIGKEWKLRRAIC